MKVWERFLTKYDQFLFESCDPRICSYLRLMIGVLLIPYGTLWLLDASTWFTASGVLSGETAQQLYSTSRLSLLFLTESMPWVVYIWLAIFLAQSVLLLLGFHSRFQAACLFLTLSAFQHRNPLIVDGEDNVLRLLLFTMIFMPLDYALAVRRRPQQRSPSQDRASAWALRLVQFELTAIYFSTAWCKWQGSTWRDGTALYYVSRMDDLFGRIPVPDTLFETLWIVQLSTWSVLALETMLPFAFWIKPLRKLAIVLAIGLHLSIELTMHLFLFEWIMIAALIVFVQPERWHWRKRPPAPLASPPAAE